MVPPVKPGPIDAGNAIEWGHPDNKGLACLLASPAETGGGAGAVWKDLTGKTAGATLQGGATWAGTPYGQTGLSLNGSGQYATAGRAVSDLPYTLVATALAASVAGDTTVIAVGKSGAYDSQSRVLISGGAFRANDIGRSGAQTLTNITTTAAANVRYRVAAVFTTAGTSLYVNGVPVGTGGYAGVRDPADYDYVGVGVLLWSSPIQFWNGLLADARVHGVAADAGLVARDYEWSQDPQRDPRLRRTSTRSFFVTSGGVLTYSFVPVFAPGWGW